MVANLLAHSFLLLWPQPQWGFCSPWTLGKTIIKKEEVQSLPTPQALRTLFAHRCPKQFMPWWTHRAAKEKPCLKSLTTLLRIVQTTHLPTTPTALLKANDSMLYVPGLNRTFLPFKHSWRINVSNSSGLLMWCTWARNTPQESEKPSLFPWSHSLGRESLK